MATYVLRLFIRELCRIWDLNFFSVLYICLYDLVFPSLPRLAFLMVSFILIWARYMISFFPLFFHSNFFRFCICRLISLSVARLRWYWRLPWSLSFSFLDQLNLLLPLFIKIFILSARRLVDEKTETFHLHTTTCYFFVKVIITLVLDLNSR